MKVFASCAAVLLLGACAGSNSAYYADDPLEEGSSSAYRASQTAIEDGRALEISRIGTYTHTGIHEPRRLIIRNETEWRSFWSDMDPGTRPDVDFNDYMVIAVAAGTKPTTGHSIRVERVGVDDSGRLVAEVIETQPGPECLTAAQVTYPVDVVVVPRRDLRTWSFTERQDVRSC